jgi:hypothetical protein
MVCVTSPQIRELVPTSIWGSPAEMLLVQFGGLSSFFGHIGVPQKQPASSGAQYNHWQPHDRSFVRDAKQMHRHSVHVGFHPVGPYTRGTPESVVSYLREWLL